jgi:hypothetical protein
LNGISRGSQVIEIRSWYNICTARLEKEANMATETITRLIDDLDGGTAERTVTFSWDGRSYEIDLTKKNLAAFEKVMKPYLDAARSASPPSRTYRRRAAPRGASTGGGRRDDLAVIREWARAHGHEVSDRGRVSATILKAYEAR